MENQKRKFEIEKNNKMNVKPKFLNVMKRFLFTMMTLVALVLVANTTFAATGDKFEPYQGGKYSYTVGTITVQTAGTAGISFIGFDTAPTISGVNRSGSNPSYVIPTGGTTLAFDLTYDLNETTGVDTVVVTVTEGSCTNKISLAVTITAKPTLTLTLAAGTPSCSNVDGTTVDGTAPGSTGATANTFNYTITPGSMAGVDSFKVTFALDAYTFGSVTNAKTAGTSSGGASAGAAITVTQATDAQTITVTYNTTPGAGTTFTGTMTTAKFKLPASAGGGEYDCTLAGNNATATVAPVPVIGTFQ